MIPIDASAVAELVERLRTHVNKSYTTQDLLADEAATLIEQQAARIAELELENLGIVSQGYASVRTTFSRTHVPVEHIVNGVPSALAWRLLLPFLRDDDAIRMSRVS